MNKEQIKVRLYATAEIRIPVTTEIDVVEFRDWYEEERGPLVEVESDDLLAFINDNIDSRQDTAATFPKPDVDVHELLTFDIDEVEILCD